MRPRLVLTAATVVMVGSFLVACGEDASETSAVCDSVDSLQSSVDDLKDIDLTDSGAVSDLTEGLTSVTDDLADVKADASSEFATEVDAVSATFTALKTSLEAAAADASAATVAAVGAALTAFSTDAKALVSDVKSTC